MVSPRAAPPRQHRVRIISTFSSGFTWQAPPRTSRTRRATAPCDDRGKLRTQPRYLHNTHIYYWDTTDDLISPFPRLDMNISCSPYLQSAPRLYPRHGAGVPGRGGAGRVVARRERADTAAARTVWRWRGPGQYCGKPGVDNPSIGHTLGM